jgi:hypothetical protein
MRGGAVDRRRGNPAAEPELTATSRTALRTSGTVTGVPRRWLRLEAAVLLSGSLIAYPATGQPWWLVPAAILVPDLLAAGYLGGTRLGAQLYNVMTEESQCVMWHQTQQRKSSVELGDLHAEFRLRLQAVTRSSAER